MQAELDLTTHDTLLHRGELLAVGTVRVAAQHVQFTRSKALCHHHVVLPRSAMTIRQGARPAFVADRMHLTLHDPGVPYRREAIAGMPDLSDYIMLDASLAEELLGRQRRFAMGQRLLSAPGYVVAQALLRSARGVFASRPCASAHEPAAAVDHLALEEGILCWLGQHVMADGAPPPRAARPVARARRFLAEHAARAPTLAEVARAACVSPFHLTRCFRAETGLSLQGYRRALQARAALMDMHLHAGCLQALARQLGYVDLPHLSRSLRQAFGIAPRQWLRGAG